MINYRKNAIKMLFWQKKTPALDPKRCARGWLAYVLQKYLLLFHEIVVICLFLGRFFFFENRNSILNWSTLLFIMICTTNSNYLYIRKNLLFCTRFGPPFSIRGIEGCAYAFWIGGIWFHTPFRHLHRPTITPFKVSRWLKK